MENKEKYLKENCDKNVMSFFQYLEDVEKEIKKEFKYNYCLFIKMEFEKDDNNNNIDNLYPITSFITYYHPINYNSYKYKIENFLVDGINSKTTGFFFMIEHINNEYLKDIEYKQTNIENIKQLIINDIKNSNGIKRIRESEGISNESTNSQSFFIVESYEVLELEGVFVDYKNKGNYTKILKEYGFLSGNNIVTKLKEEYKKYINNGIIPNDKTLPSIPKNDSHDNFLLKKDPLNFSSKNNNTNNLLSKLFEQDKNQNYDKSYIGGFKINDYIEFFTSNKLISNKKDWSLLIYDKKSNQYTIKDGYSLLLSQNNSSIINIPKSLNKNNENIILLLSACKRYVKGQNNGIILSKINLDNKSLNSKFYNSETFEVYCFCPIKILSENGILKYEIKTIETEYFLVGGFDPKRKKGLIKLYTINSIINSYDYTIKFIQDIKFEKKGNFKGFKSPIICITQSKYNGKILVNCLDGNAYLFYQPELALLIKIHKEKTIIKNK